MNANSYEEPLSPPIQPPTNPFNSPPLSYFPSPSQPQNQYPSPSHSFNQIQYPTQSPYLSQSQAMNSSFSSINNNNVDTYYDVGDILDGYADDIMDKRSPILINNSPHFSLFNNNNLTEEGAIYAKGSSIGYMDVPGMEGIPDFEDKSSISQWEEQGHISTVITDSTVIDSLESDLLNHKVQSRKSIGSMSSSLKSTPLKNDMGLTSIEEKDEADQKKASSSTEKGKQGEEEKDQEKKEEELEGIEIPDELKEKKQQFRLSFLTSKSSNSTLKRNLAENKLKESQTIEEEGTAGKSEANNGNDDDWEAKKDSTVNSTVNTINTTDSSSKSSDAGSGSQSPKLATPYFVHPAQLYHMLQVLCSYAIARLPRRAQPISERWLNTSNTLALNFWELLKYKEDVISQIIIYATFYDQVKSRAFPLHDPERVFLKELISSMNVDAQTPTLAEIKAKKSRKNRNRSISDPYLPQKFKGSGNEILKTIENQLSNQKLIMQIKKELLI